MRHQLCARRIRSRPARNAHLLRRQPAALGANCPRRRTLAGAYHRDDRRLPHHYGLDLRACVGQSLVCSPQADLAHVRSPPDLSPNHGRALSGALYPVRRPHRCDYLGRLPGRLLQRGVHPLGSCLLGIAHPRLQELPAHQA